MSASAARNEDQRLIQVRCRPRPLVPLPVGIDKVGKDHYAHAIIGGSSSKRLEASSDRLLQVRDGPEPLEPDPQTVTEI